MSFQLISKNDINSGKDMLRKVTYKTDNYLIEAYDYAGTVDIKCTCLSCVPGPKITIHNGECLFSLNADYPKELSEKVEENIRIARSLAEFLLKNPNNLFDPEKMTGQD